jgi:excisionase family DNA binding protein
MESQTDFSRILETLRSSTRAEASEQRLLARIGRDSGYDARQRLESANEWLSIREVSRVLGCSKSSVRKFVRQNLLRSRNVGLRRVGKRCRIPWDSVRDLIHAAQKWQQYEAVRSPTAQQSFLKRFLQTSSPADIRRIPAKLTVSDTAILLRCSYASVLRMVRREELRAERRTPYRWLILKSSFRRRSAS